MQTPHTDAIRNIFSPEGILSDLVPAHVHRRPQANLAGFVDMTLAAGHHGIQELGFAAGNRSRFSSPQFFTLTARAESS